MKNRYQNTKRSHQTQLFLCIVGSWIAVSMGNLQNSLGNPNDLLCATEPFEPTPASPYEQCLTDLCADTVTNSIQNLFPKKTTTTQTSLSATDQKHLALYEKEVRRGVQAFLTAHTSIRKPLTSEVIYTPLSTDDRRLQNILWFLYSIENDDLRRPSFASDPEFMKAFQVAAQKATFKSFDERLVIRYPNTPKQQALEFERNYLKKILAQEKPVYLNTILGRAGLTKLRSFIHRKAPEFNTEDELLFLTTLDVLNFFRENAYARSMILQDRMDLTPAETSELPPLKQTLSSAQLEARAEEIQKIKSKKIDASTWNKILEKDQDFLSKSRANKTVEDYIVNACLSSFKEALLLSPSQKDLPKITTDLNNIQKNFTDFASQKFAIPRNSSTYKHLHQVSVTPSRSKETITALAHTEMNAQTQFNLETNAHFLTASTPTELAVLTPSLLNLASTPVQDFCPGLPSNYPSESYNPWSGVISTSAWSSAYGHRRKANTLHELGHHLEVVLRQHDPKQLQEILKCLKSQHANMSNLPESPDELSEDFADLISNAMDPDSEKKNLCEMIKIPNLVETLDLQALPSRTASGANDAHSPYLFRILHSWYYSRARKAEWQAISLPKACRELPEINSGEIKFQKCI